MKNKPASSRRCAATLAVLAVLVSLVGLLIIWPLMAQNRAFDTEMADQVELLMRLRNMAARQSGLEEELQQFRRTADESHYYIKAQTPALGAAELQKRGPAPTGARRCRCWSCSTAAPRIPMTSRPAPG